jgi:hypothetical protein
VSACLRRARHDQGADCGYQQQRGRSCSPDTIKEQTTSLFWRDRNQQWHRYTRLGSSARVNVLLDEIEADPTAIFWG